MSRQKDRQGVESNLDPKGVSTDLGLRRTLSLAYLYSQTFSYT